MKLHKTVAGLRPGRSRFDNSYYKTFDCEMGTLYPIMCDLYLPGDHVKIGSEVLVRMNPLIAPIMHRIDIKAEYFAVPLNIMWPKPIYYDEDGNDMYPGEQDPGSWQEFITGGVKGKYGSDTVHPHPKWIPTNNSGLYSLWDYFGFPLGKILNDGIAPWPKRAYNICYNEYYRAQDYIDPVEVDSEELRKRCYEKDYFTSALIELQRGIAPSVPLTGQGGLLFENDNIGELTLAGFTIAGSSPASNNPSSYQSLNTHTRRPEVGTYPAIPVQDLIVKPGEGLLNAKINMENVSTFELRDLRWIAQIQKHLERSMRSGARYAEHIQAHWSVNTGDARIHRPEFIGSVRQPIIISEVLQTSRTEDGQNPQGTMAGHGISAANFNVGSYYCRDYMVIIGLMSIVPKPAYQQGINRQWLYKDRFDYPTPELVNVGEQEIFNSEIMVTADESWNKGIFGYQGRYDEHRIKHNMVCGRIRNDAPQSLGFWQLARLFDENNPPILNKEFLEINDDVRYLAVQKEADGSNVKPFIVTYGNRIRRTAPLPVQGTPGLLDHH